MKLYLSLPLVAVVFGLAITSGRAQDANDDVLLRAMKDEITRNVNELKLPDLEKPFFMMYGVVDQKQYSVAAQLGSLVRSNVTPERYRSTSRVLVGDYTFNDESLEDNMFSAQTSFDVAIPMEDDYLGIRRSFWRVTDNVYRSAARHYQRNQEALKETGKKLEEIPHRSFAKSNAVTMINSATPYNFDAKKWETEARKLSELFLKHPIIRNSGVIINYIEGSRYLVSTEGAAIKTPFSLATIIITGVTKTEDGDQQAKVISYNGKTPDSLPNEEQLTREVGLMIAEIESKTKLTKFDEEYSGPVLFVGQSVAEAFSSGLLSGSEGISASDNIPKLTGGFQFDNEISQDGKVGKSVVSDIISVSAKPKMKTFNGQDLLGSFEVDPEGIVPDNEVKVIEKGVLKTLLNNRTNTNAAQKANGFSAGPGVLEVSVAAKDSEKSLMKKLLEEAKRQKLEYAIIVRSKGESIFQGQEVSRVNVKTGKEERLEDASIGRVTMKILKKVLGATSAYQVCNLGTYSGMLMGRGLPGITSFIVPQQILIDGIDVTPARMPVFKEEDYVKNPLSEL